MRARACEDAPGSDGVEQAMSVAEKMRVAPGSFIDCDMRDLLRNGAARKRKQRTKLVRRGLADKRRPTWL